MRKNDTEKASLRETWALHQRAFRILNKNCPRLFLAQFLYQTVHAVIPYVGIYFSAQIINELSGNRNTERLWKLIILTISVTAVLGILNAVLERWKRYKEEPFWYQKNKIYVNKMLQLDFCSVEEQRTHDLLSQVKQNENWGGWGLGNIVYQYFSNSIEAGIKILSALVLTVSLFTRLVPEDAGMLTVLNHPLILFVMICMLLLATFLSSACESKANRILADTAESSRLGNRIFGFFGYTTMDRERALDMRIYNQQEICEHHFTRNNAFSTGSKYAGAARGKMGMFSALGAAISTSFTGIVYLYVCLKAWAGAFGIGSVTQYIGAITALAKGFTLLLSTVGAMRNNVVFLRTTFEYLDIPNDMYQGSLTTEKRADRDYEVEFKDVSFKYPGTDTWALRHVSMKFKVGQRLAVVGRNGSGKTTFIKLLSRLYDPTEGQILLNGIDIRKYNYDDYMNLFSVVFQDFKLLALPLGENVAAGSKADKERVIDCLNKAGFSEKLSKMPEGLDTYLYKDLNEKGVEISGGEAQKIAIARALYKDAPFIILDEPTAALDPVAEAEIYTKFNEIVGDKTAIYISHRLSSCRFCDEIAVFDNGQIVQQGSHDELVENEAGKYYELWYAQAQYYNE